MLVGDLLLVFGVVFVFVGIVDFGGVEGRKEV